jgi:ankyrin repeat protein
MIPLWPQDGDTALIKAAYEGHEGCVRLLVEAGADRSIKGYRGRTALDYATEQGHTAIQAILS